MSGITARVLLVEGKEDLRVIPELMEANGVLWPKKPPVYIRDCDGYSKLADTDLIATELQASGLVALGIMIDADENPTNRWQSIRNVILKSVPDLPATLPKTGLIHSASNGIKLGIWIMPDNSLRGMLETFLAYLIPADDQTIWSFAQTSVAQAKQQGARFTDANLDKAHIYTWLAWQDPPGRQLHQALQQRILDPKHPEAEGFVTWFKTLYDLHD